jgi:hypothetical protein
MNIFTGNYSNYSNLFGSTSLFSSSTSSSGTGIESLLSDYASIKSGTYGKLMKAYYEKNPTATGIAGSSNGASADTTTQIKELESTSSDLSKSASALYSSSAKSLYEEGNEDNLYKAVSDFTEKYNSAVKAAGDSNNTKVLRSASNMTSAATYNSNLLAKAGITIQSDNTLSIDEDTFKKADASTKKTLFSGAGSFAYQTGTSASFMNLYASQDASKSSGLYNSYGTYSTSLNTGSLYDSLF